MPDSSASPMPIPAPAKPGRDHDRDELAEAAQQQLVGPMRTPPVCPLPFGRPPAAGLTRLSATGRQPPTPTVAPVLPARSVAETS